MTFGDIVFEDARAGGFMSERLRGFAFFRKIFWLVRNRPGFACVFWFRVNQLLKEKRWRGSMRIRVWRHYKFSCDISEDAHIGPGLVLPHPIDVVIGSNARVGSNVTIYNGTTLGSKHVGGDNVMPTIGDHVIIYTGAKIIGGVSIGDYTHIGAMALCTKDVPAHSVMYGIPPNVTIKQKAG